MTKVYNDTTKTKNEGWTYEIKSLLIIVICTIVNDTTLVLPIVSTAIVKPEMSFFKRTSQLNNGLIKGLNNTLLIFYNTKKHFL